MVLTPEQVRSDIPFLEKYVYLDNGATTPVPKPIQEAMDSYYNDHLANIERGAYSVAHAASEIYDAARGNCAKLLLGCKTSEFIFTKSLTQASNTVAYGLEHPMLTGKGDKFAFADPVVKWERGDKILGTVLEHHSNTMPWIRLAKRLGLEFDVAKPAQDHTFQSDDIMKLMTPRTKLVTMQHVSNVLGSIHPIKEIVHAIKKENSECLVFIDGSQGPGHIPVNVKDIGCDFYGFSGHKGPLAPPGTGGLYMREGIIERMESPELGGGMMVDIELDGPSYAVRTDDPGKRFTAGTPNIPGMIGMGRGAVYVAKEIGIEAIDKRERDLALHAVSGMRDIPGITVYGPTKNENRGGAVTFNLGGWSCHDVANALDAKWNVLVRSGHHCCLPLGRWLGITDTHNGSVRASFGYYNRKEEVDLLLDALKVLAGVK